MRTRALIVAAAIFSLCTAIYVTAADRPSKSVANDPPIAPNQIIGYAPTHDRNAPSDQSVPVIMTEPDRIKPGGPMNFTETPEEQALRSGIPCSTIVYKNGCLSGCWFFLFGGAPPQNNVVDDLIIPDSVTDRFICAAQAVTSTFLPFGGPPFYNLRQQLWDNCPDDPTAHLLAQGDFEGIPNDGNPHPTTITVDPPYYVDIGIPVYQLVQSNHPAADIVITNDTSDLGDVGTTGNYFYIAGTNCTPYGPSAPTWAGFYMLLYGGPGPAGSCCDLGSGVCTDGLLHSACADFLTQSWSDQPCSTINCIACNPVCNLGDAGDIENEPDCFTNYDDTTNRGCSNLTLGALTSYFTPLTCNQSGCGRTGTYTYLNNNFVNGAPAPVTENRRDADHYALDLTQDTRVTWTVSGKFPSQALIAFTLKQSNTGLVACPDYRIENFEGSASTYQNFAARYNAVTATSAAPCQDAVTTAILAGRNDPGGPLRYMLIARPSVTRFGTTAICGIPYNFNLQCESVSPQPTGACCTVNGCIEVSALACLLMNNGTHAVAPYYQGDGTTCAGSGSVCSGAPANDLCPNSIVLTCTSCIVIYDTTFAHGEGDIYGSGGFVSKDVWFDYSAPTAANSYNCAAGRIVASTLYNCFNTKLQILQINNCSLNAIQRCISTNLSLAGVFIPIELDVGPPIVDVGPWVYGKQAIAAQAPGTCFKIRVGGLTDTDFGPGIVRIDYVCQSAIANGWDSSAGRCCFWNAGTHTGNCMVAPRITAGTNTGCGCLGGYLRDSTDYFELSTTHPTSAAGNLTIAETQGMGCATWPCPAEGEACYNAWDLNSILGGSGFGTAVKSTRNRLYFKYQVPAGTPVGSGITIDACGSNIDSAMAVYRGFNLTTGECHQLDTTCPAGTPCTGNQACTNTFYNNTELARVDDCGPRDYQATSATGLVACFAPGETSPCLCLTVVAGNPTFGQIPLDAPVYIGLGLKNTLVGSSRPFVDPVRSDSCGQDATIRLHVASVPSCFSCSISCPGGATQESENLGSCTGYIDHTNAGCSTSTLSDQRFLPIVCGQTYCGTSATYRVNKACVDDTACNPIIGDHCVTGTCQGYNDTTLDYDFYRIQLTQPQNVTWTVNSTFPAAIQILESPDDQCSTAVVLASLVNLSQCATTVISADACPGYVYLSVAPGLNNHIGCGKLYYATLTCDAPSIAVNACCKGDMNNDGFVNGQDIRPWLDQVLPFPNGQPSSALDKIHGCFDPPTCRADTNNDYLVDLNDLASFVSLLLASVPCAPTACGSTDACHIISSDDSGVISDLNLVQFGGGTRVADDFKVTSAGLAQPVTKICWYGFYYNFNALAACAGPLGDSSDDFRITIYADSSGLPGNALANASAVIPLNLVKTNTGQSLNYLNQPVTSIKYEADLPAGITVDSGICYWLEIVNKTTGSCLWLWETSATSGNGVSMQQPGGFPAGTSNYYSFNVAAQDQSFCLPGLRIDAADCGLPLGRCCMYDILHGGVQWLPSTCSVQTRPTCETAMPGPNQIARWTIGQDCSTTCPLLPGNDNCADALLITSGPFYTGSTIYATTDGPAMTCESSCGTQCNTAPDVWYKWVSGHTAIQTTVSMCDILTEPDPTNYPKDQYTYDAMMVMYTACPANNGTQVPGGCNDNCSSFSFATVSRFILSPGTLSTNSTYWIRISGWQGNKGQFTLRVHQP